MNHNKNYFLFYVPTVTTNDGTGLIRANFSLRYILGQLYDKHLFWGPRAAYEASHETAFNITIFLPLAKCYMM